jgi:hypothetical protein
MVFDKIKAFVFLPNQNYQSAMGVFGEAIQAADDQELPHQQQDAPAPPSTSITTTVKKVTMGSRR